MQVMEYAYVLIVFAFHYLIESFVETIGLWCFAEVLMMNATMLSKSEALL